MDKFDLLSAMLMLNSQQTNAREDLFGASYAPNGVGFKPQTWAMYGYPNEPVFDHYYALYERNGAARSVVRLPVNECWSGYPKICIDPANKEDAFEREVLKLDRRIGLFRSMKGVDERQRIGQYAALMVIIKDGRDLKLPIGRGEVVQLKPLYESQVKPVDWDHDSASATYGHPIMYQVQENAIGDRDPQAGRSTEVHPSRLIFWAEGSDDGTIWGESALKPVLNSILCLDKIEGAGGTGFFRNARGAQTVNFEGADIGKLQQLLGADKPSDIMPKLNDMVDGLNKYGDAVVALMNAKMQTITITLPDPEKFAKLCWDMIAAATGYPETIMRGSQTGERASNNDQAQAQKETNSRRMWFLDSAISRTINKLIELGALPKADYTIYWPQSGNAEMLKLLADATRGHGVDIAKLAEIAGFDRDQFAADELPMNDKGENIDVL